MKRIGTVLAAMLAAALGIVALPPTEAHAAPDPYTQEGLHVVNGREWRTTCDAYSPTVTRCRAEIKATQVKLEGGRFVEVTDWAFNNLTYLPSPREQWKGNPLAANGVIGGEYRWTDASGRQWRTECDTATTGRNGCRTYTMTTIYAVKTLMPRTYEQRNEWLFNNVVQFSAPKPAPAPTPKPTPPPAPVYCNATALPSGFALTSEGRPHAVKTPYSPNTLYNPTSISNFISANLRIHNTLDPKSQRAQDVKCLALLGAKHLMEGSQTTRNAKNEVVRWFPYMFRFSANPTMDDLTAPWHSGLAQGGVLPTFIGLANLTGDKTWLDRGAETFRSFEVPISEPGGILHRNAEHSFLWFEEYPTTPLPTTVLNGHLEAVIGLDLWHRRMVADGASAVIPPEQIRALIDEALATLEPMLKIHEVPIDGGLLTSYDALRGYPAAPLRVLGKDVKVTASLNNQRVTLPAVEDSWKPNTYTANGGFTALTETDQSVPVGWTRFGSAQYASVVPKVVGGQVQGDYVRIVSGGNAWQGFQQLVPPSWISAVAGKELSMTVRAAVKYPVNAAGASGRVAVFNDCPSGRSLQYENVLRGNGDWHDYTFGFTAPAAGCGMLVQLMISPYTNNGTEVWFDDFNVSAGQPVGTSLKPTYDLKVYRTPVNTLQLTGTGTGTVQAHQDGRWRNIARVTLSNTPQNVVIPERFTGRNIHLGYHETHVGELLSLYSRNRTHTYLRDYAERWAPMAPSRHHTVPDAPRTTARSVSPMGLDPITVGDETLLLPPLVDQFTGLPYEELEMLDELQKPAE